MQMYSEADVDTSALLDRQITILGYGSQGRAHALNLKDSGFDVVVGLRRDGASWAKAEADGLKVAEPIEAVKGAAIVAFLTPDMVQKSLYAAVVDAIDEGAALLFAHGFAVLSEEAHLLYKCTSEYDKAAERGIRWDDPEIGVVWSIDEPLVSERDAALPFLSDADVFA